MLSNSNAGRVPMVPVTTGLVQLIGGTYIMELPSVVRKEKLETLQQLRQERKEEEAENFSKQRRRRNCSFKSLLSFLLYPLGL